LVVPAPLGRIRGHLFETVDSFLLPKVWPSLLTSEFFVDSRVPGLNAAFTIGGHVPLLRRLMERFQSVGLVVARRFGASTGGLGWEIEGPGGAIMRFALATADRAYRIGASPAVMAAAKMAGDRFAHRGLVACDELVGAEELFRYLSDQDIRVEQW
jgi:hypothetical protein